MTTDKIRESNRKAVEKYRTSEKFRNSLRNSRYKNRYGISLEEYNILVEKQNHVCAICLCPEKSKGVHQGVKTLSVDHCHGTGKVRGLLCSNCNAMLGMAKDNITVFHNAIKYLKDTK